MKNFKEYLKENSWFKDPADDVRKYIVGLATRLRLLTPEEIEQHRDVLAELQGLIGTKLGGRG